MGLSTLTEKQRFDRATAFLGAVEAHPDVWAAFLAFGDVYFEDILENALSVVPDRQAEQIAALRIMREWPTLPNDARRIVRSYEERQKRRGELPPRG